ncbi:MAG: rhamnan synthesis F family protein, partial [Oscillospiraceae bacterium]
GMLCPTPPNTSDFYPTLGSGEWSSNYETTLELAKKLKLDVDFDYNKPPISPLGTMFWFRPKAMKPIYDYDFNYHDFPKEPNKVDGTILHAIERIYPFVVQSTGHYPAYSLCDTFSSLDLVNLNFTVGEVNKVIFKKYGFSPLHQLIVKVKKIKISRIYVFKRKLGSLRSRLFILRSIIKHKILFYIAKSYFFLKNRTIVLSKTILPKNFYNKVKDKYNKKD